MNKSIFIGLIIYMIVGISGKIGSGKTTVSEVFRSNGFELDSFAKSVKDICCILFGFDRDRLEGQKIEDRKWRETNNIKYTNLLGRDFSPRDSMILIGTAIGRDIIHPNIWVETLFNRYEEHKGKNLLITDVRFPNEYDEIKKRGGIIIRINRKTMENNSAHPSECALDDHPFDYIIDNDGTYDELMEKAKKLLTNISIN